MPAKRSSQLSHMDSEGRLAMVDVGGLVVRVGDWLYDASVRTQFINIRNQLFESANHEIQSRRDHFGNWEGN